VIGFLEMTEEVDPTFPTDMVFVEDYGPKLDIATYEPTEMKLAWRFVQPDDIVLELGARVGVVSCTICRRLNNPKHLVAVEPDQRAIYPLQKNKMKNNCDFQVYPGFVSKQPLSLKDHHIWTHSYYDPESVMDRCTLEELQKSTGCTFNVLVADCEGFLETFFDENPWFYDQLRMIIYERDAPQRCNYVKIEEQLRTKGFQNIVDGFNCVWMK
jgi:FkbM family methyltransferase